MNAGHASEGRQERELLLNLTPGEVSAGFCGLAGRSPGMRRLFEQLRLIANSFQIAAIEGEDGTGKSTIALVLHRLSPSAARPFVPCLASSFLRPDSTEPASQGWDREILKRTQGGTLFLDRTHELDELQQSRLFRFLLWLEHQQFLSLAYAPRHVVVTSDLPLRRLSSAHTFRSDLCSRLTAIRLLVPPLRERREDIPLLAQSLVNRFSQIYRKQVRGLGPGTLAPLLRYSWPGNVREFESVITTAALTTEGGWIRPIDLPNLTPWRPLETAPSTSPQISAQPKDISLDAAIQLHIARVLEQTRGNKLRAAALLGIGRSTLYRLLASSASRL